MIDETAVVRSYSERSIEFQILTSGACDACEIREHCYRNDGLLSVPRDRLSNPYHVDMVSGMRIGLRIANTSMLGVTGIVYGIPLAVFIIGLFVGYEMIFTRSTEILRALSSFVLAISATFGVGFVISRFDGKVAANLRYDVHPSDA
ncbi:MAG: SoxR reducing system RseC family protein [Alkalispirochaeta sp.]